MHKELFNLRDLKKDDIKKYIDFLSDPEVTSSLFGDVKAVFNCAK